LRGNTLQIFGCFRATLEILRSFALLLPASANTTIVRPAKNLPEAPAFTFLAQCSDYLERQGVDAGPH